MGYWWGSHKERDTLGRPRNSWVGNIKTDLKEIGWDSVDWIDLAQDKDQWRALLKTVMNLRVPSNVGKFPVAALLAASQEGLSSASK
jgi:hypothetical protein